VKQVYSSSLGIITGRANESATNLLLKSNASLDSKMRPYPMMNNAQSSLDIMQRARLLHNPSGSIIDGDLTRLNAHQSIEFNVDSPRIAYIDSTRSPDREEHNNSMSKLNLRDQSKMNLAQSVNIHSVQSLFK